MSPTTKHSLRFNSTYTHISHVANLFPSLKGRVQIITTAWLSCWISACIRDVNLKEHRKTTLGRLKLTARISEWRQHQIIAYPVYSVQHWSLALLVNLAWSDIQTDVVSVDWTGFHFDSYPTGKDAIRTAKAVGQHLTGIKHRRNLRFIEVPVPGQKQYTNDCALWPAHYLRTFLENIPAFTKHCMVSWLTRVLLHYLTKS